VSCALIAEHNESKQRDYWYSVARDAVDLESAQEIGRKTGLRSAARLGARKIATCEVPVIFEAPIASSLIGHFASAISGGTYRKSFLPIASVNKFSRQIFKF
jgi:PmbA protein